MSQILQIFNSAESKQYFVDDNNVLWLHGHLLCQRLGFKNPSRDIQLHTESDERQKVPTGGLEEVWFVNEYGVWGMILAAKTKEAKEFKHYLKYDVLPSIRSKGGYIAPTASNEQVEALVEEYKTQRNLAESESVNARQMLSDLQTEFDFVKQESIPKLKEFIHTVSNICSDLERGLYTDAADIMSDCREKRYKKVEDVEKLGMLSTRASITELKRACESLKGEEFAGLQKTLTRFSNQFED